MVGGAVVGGAELTGGSELAGGVPVVGMLVVAPGVLPVVELLEVSWSAGVHPVKIRVLSITRINIHDKILFFLM